MVRRSGEEPCAVNLTRVFAVPVLTDSAGDDRREDAALAKGARGGIGPGKWSAETSPQCTPALMQRSTSASSVYSSQAFQKSACNVSPELPEAR